MALSVEIQELILMSLLVKPWEIATILKPANSVNIQFNIWTGNPESARTLEIDPASTTSQDSIRNSFVHQLDAMGIQHS